MSFRRMKWVYAVAGSGVVFGVLNYLQEQKRWACNSWTTNFTPSVTWDHNWDLRGSTEPSKSPFTGAGDSSEENKTDDEKLKRTASRSLILVRHGQYNLNGKKDADRKLTPLGRVQADIAGLRLKELDYKFTRIVHSSLTRAIETAQIIHKHLSHLPMDVCSLLEEGSPIPPEPPIGNYSPPAEYFEDGPRIEAAFRKYFYRASPEQKENSYEIIVCHANVIRYFLCRALQFPPEAWLRFSLRHCSFTMVTIWPDGTVSVTAVGDCGHIPNDKLTVR